MRDSGCGDRETLDGADGQRLFRGAEADGKGEHSFANPGGGKQPAQLVR